MAESPTAPARTAPCPCGSGRRYKSCCYERDRTRASLRSAAQAAHAQVDAVLSELLAVIAERGERKLACGPGCNACCHQLVRCTWAEALLIAEYLLLPAQAALLAQLDARVASPQSSPASELVPLNALLARHRGIPNEPVARQNFFEILDGYNRRWVMCPFNDERGYCGIYPVRPLPCRVAYVVDTAEHCGPRATTSPAWVQHPALSGAINAARQQLLAAGDRASRPPEQELITLVREALATLRG